MKIPDNMITVEQYANKNGVSVELVIARIRDAKYIGKKVGDQWYIESPSRQASYTSSLKNNTKSTASINEVVITNFNMPFWSMVKFMVKWAVASIPAFIILFILFFIAYAVLGTFISTLS